MDIILFFLFLISIVYCCDLPAIHGFEVFINNHDSMLYGIGLSIIAAYIFYVFQALIPRLIRLRQSRGIACAKTGDIAVSIEEMFSVLQGTPFLHTPFAQNAADTNLKESISSHLSKIDIFSENSQYVIVDHKELSVFDACVYIDDKIAELIEEILSNQYMEPRFNKLLLELKNSRLHYAIVFWIDKQPGEYEHCNKDMKPGLIVTNNQLANSQIVSAIDEYAKIYKRIIRLRNRFSHLW